MSHPMLRLVVCLLCLRAAFAFTSTNLYEREVIYNGKPTTVVTTTYLATNLDNTGTFSLDSGCTGVITVQAPTYHYVVQQIGNVPNDVVSVEEISCSVADIDAYRSNLEANGFTLDIVLNYDGDNETIVSGSNPSAMRRRLLQLQDDPDYDDLAELIRSFAATSTEWSDESRQSLNSNDAWLYSMILSYTPVNVSFSTSTSAGAGGLLGGISLLASNDQHLKNAVQRQIDVDRKLQQRGNNTDRAVQILTQFVIDAYIQQQTNLTQLFGLQNVTTAAVLYLFDAIIQVIQNEQNLNLYTGLAIQGLLDYREADRSIWQAWVDNNELKDLATALYFHDEAELPDGYEAFVRHVGIPPNASFVEGAGARLYIDTFITNSASYIYTPVGASTVIPQGYAGIFQNTFTTYLATEFAILFPADQADSRFLLSVLGPAGCTPPELDLGISWVDVTQWGSSILSPYPIANQSFPDNGTTCDVWVEATVCQCVWYSGLHNANITFQWQGVPGFLSGNISSLSSICSNSANTEGASATFSCSSMIITTPTQLQSVLTLDLCGNQVYWSGCIPYTGNCRSIPFQDPYSGGAPGTTVVPVNSVYFFSQQLQLGGSCVTSNGFCNTPNINPMSEGQGVPSALAAPTLLPNYLATIITAFPYMTTVLAQLRLAKFGRIAGVETVTVPTNLYISTQYDQAGNIIPDGSATPLRCEKTFWNAYTQSTIPVYSYSANSANLVTNNISVTITCPVCTNADSSCYNISTSNVTQNVLTFDPGSFALDSSFVVLGDLSASSLSYVYDVPAAQLSVSPVIESRSFAPTYIFLPVTQAVMPDWNTFVALEGRNVRYSAAYGGVSPQAYKQAVVPTQAGGLVCASNFTARVPGGHLCSIFAAYTPQINNGQGSFSAVRYQVQFSLTVPSGVFFDTVDITNRCPLITLQPKVTGAVGLIMINDDSMTTLVQVSYGPNSDDTGVACPSACCTTSPITVQISAGLTGYYEIPQCGFVNLTVSVSSVQQDGSTYTCFTATGQSLYDQIITAATAAGVNYVQTVNYTQQYPNFLASFYDELAFQALLNYQEAVTNNSLASQQLILDLKAQRDYYQRQVLYYLTTFQFDVDFPLNTTLLYNQITALLSNNTAIDSQIEMDLAYMQSEIDQVQGQDPTCSPVLIITRLCGYQEPGSNTDSSDNGCPGDLWDALSNSFDPFSSQPGVLNYLQCIMDDILTTVITIVIIIVVVVVVVGCVICCGPKCCGCCINCCIRSWGSVGHQLEQARLKREELLKQDQLKAQMQAAGKGSSARYTPLSTKEAGVHHSLPIQPTSIPLRTYPHGHSHHNPHVSHGTAHN
jgi:hypothetical protein